MKVAHGLSRLWPDLVLDRQRADHPAIGDDVEDGPTVARPGFCFGCGPDAELGQQPGPSNADQVPIDLSACPSTRERLEACRFRRLDPTSARALDDGSRERVFRVGLNR